MKTILLNLFLFVVCALPAQNLSIHVNVKGNHYNNPLDSIKVVVINPENGQRFDSIYTDTIGNGDFSFLFTRLKENQQDLLVNIFSNPSNGNSKVNINSEKNATSKISIYTAKGDLVYSEDVSLQKGLNQLNLNGGGTGIYLVTVENNKQKQAIRWLNLASNGSFDIENTPLFSSSYKSNSTLNNILSDDSLTFEITSNNEGYELYDTLLKAIELIPGQEDYNENFIMIQQPYSFSTTIKPFLESGEPVTTLSPGFTTTITFPDNEQQILAPNENNEINITKPIYAQNETLGNITFKNDTSNYTVNSEVNGILNWIILRHPNQPTNRPNIAQSECKDTGGDQNKALLPKDSTSVSLDSLDSKLIYYYTERKNAESQPGTWYRMDDFPRGYIASSGETKTAKFIKTPNSRVVLVSTVYENDHTRPTDPANLARAINEYNKIHDICNLANGDVLLQDEEMQETNMEDDTYTELQQRVPMFDNVQVITFYQGPPSVSRIWDIIYSYNNNPRLKFSAARASESETTGVIFTENYSATYGIEEGSGSLSGFVATEENGNIVPTDLGKAMARMVSLLDLGSGGETQTSTKQSGFPLSWE